MSAASKTNNNNNMMATTATTTTTTTSSPRSPHGLLPARRRMHSWSRLRRSPEEKAQLRSSSSSTLLHFDDTEHCIEGKTQICFARDGEWFQGNISPPFHCVIQIHGRRIRSTSAVPEEDDDDNRNAVRDVDEDDEDDDEGGLHMYSSCSSDASMQSLPSVAASASASSSSAPEHHLLHLRSRKASETDSEACSIDSELVRTALRKLSVDERSVSEPELYRVTVSDLETGLSYKLDEVSVLRFDDSCLIYSEQLDFKSESTIRGRSANAILVSQFGPSFADQDLFLFEGDVSFRYTDKVYRPAHATESMLIREDRQWL